MQSFEIGDTVVITKYGYDPDSEYIGKVGPIKKIITHPDGLVNYFIDIDEPGILFWDLICYEGEIEHAKEKTNE